MEKLSWLKISALAIAIIISGYLIGDMLRKAKNFDRHVTVKGLSEREVKADIAVWPIEITLAGDDLKEVNTKLKHQKDQVLNFFKELGFTDKEISNGITNIVDAKANTYNNNAIFRYIAKGEITLRTNDLTKIKKALTESLSLASQGILISSKNSWQPISYSYTQLNKIKPEMIEEATKKAKEVAQKFAKDSNSSVGKIKTAQQGRFSITNRDANTPDIKLVRVVSTINYYLKD